VAPFDTPESDGFITDCDASLGQEIFNITIAEIEAVVQPDCIADDFGGESMTLVCIHRQIIENGKLN